MKKYIIYILTAVLFAGCEEYLDVNKDPNRPTDVGPEFILPAGQNFTARWMVEERHVNHLGNMIMYNWSESAGYSWYNDEFLYLVNSTFYNVIFDDAYTRALKQYEDLEDLEGDEYMAYKAIAKIMKAYTYQILVDFYGDIPYTEALQRSEIPNPAYDGAQEIYDDLIVELTTAIDMINQAEENELSILPEEDDVMYQGDLDAWKRFANTVKLRILTRVSDVKSADYITQELAVIASEGSGYITENVTINPGFINEEAKQNPYWEDMGESVAGDPTNDYLATCASDFILQFLQDRGDPRVDFLFEEPETGHLGVPQGITADPDVYSPPQVSNIGPGILIGPTQDAIIYTLAESYFNQAELALKGFGGDPEALYHAGIEASFETLTYVDEDDNEVSPGSASDYYSQPLENVNYDVSSNKLEAIITQKWLATLGLTAEQGWFDHSRTGFPSGVPVSEEIDNLERPVRLAYPASEVGPNSANIPDQPNVFETKLFWAN